MVTISGFFIRDSKLNKKPFIALELSGDVMLVQSSETGRFYATAKRCTIASTFSEEEAKMLIGKQLPGRIDRVEVEAYEYTVKETGEVITLNHTYTYNPEEGTTRTLEKPLQQTGA